MSRIAMIVAIGVLPLLAGCPNGGTEESATPTCPSPTECAPPSDIQTVCVPMEGITCEGVLLCIGYATPNLDDGQDPDYDLAYLWDGSVAKLCDGGPSCADVGNSYCAHRGPSLITPAPLPDDGGAL